QIADLFQEVMQVKWLERIGQLLMLQRGLSLGGCKFRNQEQHSNARVAAGLNWRRQGQLLERREQRPGKTCHHHVDDHQLIVAAGEHALAWLARGTMRTVQPSSSSTRRRAAWLAPSSSMIRMPIWFTPCPLGLLAEYSPR